MTSTVGPTPEQDAHGDRSEAAPAVLVVENDPKMRDVAVWALEDEGFVVDAAAGRREAADRARRRPPALVVLDMGLPPYDGEAVAADLRATCGEHLPILVITADGRASEKARQVGAFAYLHKPFDIEQLVRLVRQKLAT